ncbi:hypothetical protein EDD15DRAFT_2193949 [Pisolithus albus]|nr:hypothetical protein EDD15DRAFT_2201016 [Pisolithus albus]KAI5999287.1 hypothetical protein EDD15DRAFT_2193949 [Pisolithus albus]
MQGDGPKYTCFLKHIMVYERDRTRYLCVERCSIVFKHHARRWPKVHPLPKVPMAKCVLRVYEHDRTWFYMPNAMLDRVRTGYLCVERCSIMFEHHEITSGKVHM